MSLIAEKIVFYLLTLIFVQSAGYCMEPPKEREEQSATDAQLFIPILAPSFKEALTLPERRENFIQDWQDNLNEASHTGFVLFVQIGSYVFEPRNNERYQGVTYAGLTPYPDQAWAFYHALFYRYEKLASIKYDTITEGSIASFLNRGYQTFGERYTGWLCTALLGEGKEYLDDLKKQATASPYTVRFVDQSKVRSTVRAWGQYVRQTWAGSQIVSVHINKYLQSRKLVVDGGANDFFARLVPRQGNCLFYCPILLNSYRHGRSFFFQDGELKRETALLISYEPGNERFKTALSFGYHRPDGTGFALEDKFSDPMRQDLVKDFFPQPSNDKMLYCFIPLPKTQEEWQELGDIVNASKQIPHLKFFLELLGYQETKKALHDASRDTAEAMGPLQAQDTLHKPKKKEKGSKLPENISQKYQEKVHREFEHGIRNFNDFRKLLNLVLKGHETKVRQRTKGSHSVTTVAGKMLCVVQPHGSSHGNQLRPGQAASLTRDLQCLHGALSKTSSD